MAEITRTFPPGQLLPSSFPLIIDTGQLRNGIATIEVDNGSALTLSVFGDGVLIRTVFPYVSRFNLNSNFGGWQQIQITANNAAIQVTDGVNIVASDYPVVPPLSPSFGVSAWGAGAAPNSLVDVTPGNQLLAWQVQQIINLLTNRMSGQAVTVNNRVDATTLGVDSPAGTSRGHYDFEAGEVLFRDDSLADHWWLGFAPGGGMMIGGGANAPAGIDLLVVNQARVGNADLRILGPAGSKRLRVATNILYFVDDAGTTNLATLDNSGNLAALANTSGATLQAGNQAPPANGIGSQGTIRGAGLVEGDTLQAGTGTSPPAHGIGTQGDISIAGNVVGTKEIGHGLIITDSTTPGVAGGVLSLTAGGATAGNAQGGALTAQAGFGVGTGNGGGASLIGGAGGTGAAAHGGIGQIIAGNAGAGSNGHGGRVQLSPGAPDGTGLKPLVELDGSGSVPTAAVLATNYVGLKYNPGGTLVAYVNDAGVIRSLSLGTPA